jgi:tetratricopeptide (TPR) repeat protein
LAAVAALIALSVPMADLAGYQGAPYPWAKSTFVFICLIITFFALSWFTPKGLCFAIPSAGLQITVFILLSRGAMNGLTHPQSWWFIWPIVWNFVLLAMACLTLPYGRSVAGAAFFTQLGVAFYVYMPIVSDLRNPPMNWGYPRTWEGFKHAIQRGQYEAIGVPKFDSVAMFFEFLGGQMMHYFRDVKVQFTDFLLLFAPVPFIAGHWLVPANRRKTFWQWMIAVGSCFIMMSLLLLLLAQVKGDLQDGFIQKVKFISSHAMIAIWIGYGLVFAGAIVMKSLSTRLSFGQLKYFPIAFAAVAIFVAATYPIVQNYTDKRLVFELGGSEQNGHTFGWQFGAYQLDGHKAISQQLEADEEPLPDPSYPPPMDEFSVFFGGTDPGRFVPTYMIYAADFRPDIYLITQNALADDTYMSVQRDLYGDEIWIPAKEDSSEAFNIYLDEVQRGVRQANGDLKVENGRVQVTGALGVMEINSILTKMMFDREKFRRSFYIEESYPINWMYPYLSPHGLIMKINPRVMGYDRTLAQKDADFWDWYTRRLLNDPAFRRDFAGQKSFSKLRAALAGLYAKQRMRAQSAQAYREACLLYPASPESTFRYAQECLIHNRRFDVIRDMMDYTDSIDPNNKRTQRLREYVDNVEDIMKKISTLEQKRSAKNNFTRIDAFILAQCYASIERNQEALALIKPYAANVEQLDELKFLWPLFFKCNDMENAEKILTKLLRMRPGEDPVPWLTLARIQYRSGRGHEAFASLKTALTVNRDFTFNAIMSDGELKSIASPLMRQQPQGR